MSFFRLAVRAVVGGLFIGHGTQKLKGWFDGPGIEGTTQMMESLQMHPPRRNALMAGLSETAGGGMVAAGLGTPLGCSILIGTMTTAICKVHLPRGVWNSNGGYEYNLVLIAFLTELAGNGPGKLSLDRALRTERTGPLVALASLGAGLAASVAATTLGQHNAPDEPGH